MRIPFGLEVFQRFGGVFVAGVAGHHLRRLSSALPHDGGGRRAVLLHALGHTAAAWHAPAHAGEGQTNGNDRADNRVNIRAKSMPRSRARPVASVKPAKEARTAERGDFPALDGTLQQPFEDQALHYAYASGFDGDTGAYDGVIDGKAWFVGNPGAGLLVRPNAIQTEEPAPDKPGGDTTTPQP